MPYFLPASYDRDERLIKDKKSQCVCMMSTTLATLPFLLDAAKRFVNAVNMLGRECPEWSFYITGDFPAHVLTLPGRVKRTGFLENPFEILAESRAVALLSDYGFGFKTKLLDAIKYKCYVLVTKGLYRRLPSEVQPYCIVVDPSSANSFRGALERCVQPYPEGDPNELFRSQAFAALDELLYAT
jgi:glycosyltransferase involved in cell wall biosynthesis